MEQQRPQKTDLSVRRSDERLAALIEFASAAPSSALPEDTVLFSNPSNASYVDINTKPSAEVEEVRRVLLISFKQFVRDECWSAPIEATVRPVVWRDKDGELRLQYSSDGSWQATFWVIVADALHTSGDRLRQCQVCQQLFFRTGRRTYCSMACGQRKRSRQHYQEHRDEVLEQRHRLYAKRRRRVQPKARIKRKARVGQSKPKTRK